VGVVAGVEAVDSLSGAIGAIAVSDQGKKQLRRTKQLPLESKTSVGANLHATLLPLLDDLIFPMPETLFRTKIRLFKP
jgi:hypothetical protein